MEKPVFSSSFFQQKKTIELLIKESRADGDFYLFLSFSSFIATLGLLLNNPIVIVGAMLVAPILVPILALGMGIVTASKGALRRSIIILIKSIVTVVLISFVTAFLLNQRETTEQLFLASKVNFIFFLVAFFSGIVASFSWIKQNVSLSLPGVAITVSLIPPLASVGIALSMFSREIFSGSLLLFLINLLGIVVASTVMFSLFGFARMQEVEDKEIEKEEKEIIASHN